MKKNRAAKYMKRPGEITGELRVVWGWHAIGHSIVSDFHLIPGCSIDVSEAYR